MTLASARADAITLLRSQTQRPVSKTFVLEEDGGIGVIPYPNILAWDSKEIAPGSLEQLATVLTTAAEDTRIIAISGSLREGQPRLNIMRRYLGEDAPFEGAPRRWVALDIDGLQAPAGLAGAPREMLAKWARDLMPEGFGHASCLVQWTSSYLVDDETAGLRLDMRLWYLLSDPILPLQWRSFFKAEEYKGLVDPALYNPVQPHYLAPPRFLKGATCPLAPEDRWFLLDGDAERVDVSDLEFPEIVPEAELDTVAQDKIEAHPQEIEQTIERILGEQTIGSRHHHAIGAACELIGIGCEPSRAAEVVEELIQKQGRDPQPGEGVNAVRHALDRLKAGTLHTTHKPASQLFADEEESANGQHTELPTTGHDLAKEEKLAVYVRDAPADANAHVFLSRLFPGKGLLRWRGEDYYWDGKHWRIIEDPEFLCFRCVQDGGFPKSKANGIVDTARMMVARHDLEYGCFLDAPNRPARPVLSFANGMLHIDDVMFDSAAPSRPHDKSRFVTQLLPYAHNPDAACPRWERFLTDCFGDDAPLIRECQKFFGYILSRMTSQQKIFVLQGPPRSGKGVMSRLLSKLLGPENIVSPMMSALADRFNLEPLLDKSLILIPEANKIHDRRLLDHVVDVIKAISGEDRVSVPRKGISNISHCYMPGRFVLCCNRMPNFLDPSGALASRMIIFRFINCYVGKEDKQLEDDLQTELPGIFNWAMRGLRALLVEDGHFVLTKGQKEFLDEERKAMAPVEAFLEECLTVRKGKDTQSGIVESQRLYDIYREWCEKANRHCLNRENFFREFVQCAPDVRKERMRMGDRRPWGYRGVDFTPEGQELAKSVAGGVFDDEDAS